MTSVSSAAPVLQQRAVVLTVAGAFSLLLDREILNTTLPRTAESIGLLPLAASPTTPPM